MSDDKKAETNEAVRKYLRGGGAAGVADSIAARLEAHLPKNKAGDESRGNAATNYTDDVTNNPFPHQ